MKVNKYIIFTIIVVLVSIIIFLFLIQRHKPLNIIEDKLKIQLPSSSKIMEFKYYRKEDSFDAKILIESQSLDYIKAKLIMFFGKTYLENNLDILPNFKIVCPWWDLDKDSIETIYLTSVSEKKLFSFSSHEVWAFISIGKDDKPYLYISY